MDSIGPSGETYNPTIKANESFSADTEAEALRLAMKGIGCNRDAVNEILTRNNFEQRIAIKIAFKTLFGKDLIKELKSELKGDHEKLVLMLFKSSAEINAHALYKSIQGIGTDEKTICSILGTATNAEIRSMRNLYQEVLRKENKNVNKRNIEKDIKDDCSGDFYKVLLSLLQAQRKEPDARGIVELRKGNLDGVVDRLVAKEQALQLYEQGEKKIGTSETTFIKILCSQSVWQIAAIDYEYIQLTGHSIEKAIDKELSGDFKKIMKTMVCSCLDRPGMYAELIYKSMKGLGTKDDDLMRLLVTRNEIDLGTIKDSYKKMYNKEMARDIYGDTSGDYRKLLLMIIGEGGYKP